MSVVMVQMITLSFAASRSLIDDADLLGDFENNTQITADTNQVNQLQNQISDTISSTSNIRNQKLSIEETLAQLQKQKQEYSAQLAQVQLAFNQENGDLQKLQETLSNEEPDLQRIRQEAEAAETNLDLLRNQKQDMERKIHDGRIESEQLRRRVAEIQEETKLLKLEIQNLQSSSRKQDMMLDINRRQVTAADMDKSAATRELNEIREEHGLVSRDPTDFPDISKTQPSHEPEKSEDVAEKSSVSFGSRPPTAQSFNEIFGSAFPTRGESITSPAMTMNSFDAAFEELASPTMNTSLPKERPYSPFASMTPTLPPVDGNVNQPQAQPSAEDPFAPVAGQHKPITSFDDAFGDFEDTNGDVAAQPQEVAPKSSSSAFDDSFLRKRGTDLTIQDEDDSSDDEEVLSKVQVRNASSPNTNTVDIQSPASPVTEAEAPKPSGFDDFEEAFNGKLGEAQVAPTSGAKDFDQAFSPSFDEFDDSFEKPHQADEVEATSSDKKGKFGAFDFSDFEEKLGASTGSGHVQDDLDSLFGSPSIPAGQSNANPSAQALSFDDAFGSFDAPPTKATNDAPAAQKPSSAPDAEPSAVPVQPDDKEEIKQLVGMGFSRAQAVDALRRYDNDLEKATNFLLDN
jgi:epidermal growth factor receptor substrate 15